MIESWFFVLAMLAVLLIPGPTNALLASATHQQGAFKTIIFIPIEWLGYVYGISLWALFIHLFELTYGEFSIGTLDGISSLEKCAFAKI